jgi:hypothetical protein
MQIGKDNIELDALSLTLIVNGRIFSSLDHYINYRAGLMGTEYNDIEKLVWAPTGNEDLPMTWEFVAEEQAKRIKQLEDKFYTLRSILKEIIDDKY